MMKGATKRPTMKATKSMKAMKGPMQATKDTKEMKRKSMKKITSDGEEAKKVLAAATKGFWGSTFGGLFIAKDIFRDSPYLGECGMWQLNYVCTNWNKGMQQVRS